MRKDCHRRGARAVLALLAALSLAGCGGDPGREGPRARAFHLQDVAKGDIDMVAEVTLRQQRRYLRELADKLYRRNPVQLRRGGFASREQALRQLLGMPGRRLLAQWQGRRGSDLIELSLAPDFRGDRVAAFVYGLRSMAVAAYGGEGEFFIHHGYDPQKIYHLARNTEIAAWRLRRARDAAGRPLLLSLEADGTGRVNTSFERLFGKLIALHDQFAQVVADTGNRRIKNVIQGVASAVFFPI